MGLETLARQLGLPALTRRVRLTVARGVLHLVNDALKVQTMQVEFLSGEVRDNIERMQNYGMTSVPLAGMEPVAVFVGGDRSNGVVIAVGDRQYRLNSLRTGEVTLYDDLGQKVHLTREGINVESPFNVTVKAGQTLRLEGNEVHLHAQTLYRWDVNGHGQVWHPTSVDPWTIGETSGTPHPITPPEIG